MFCPECKAEYREGFTVCSDCGVPLVDQLPPEDKPDDTRRPEYVEFEEILRTYNPADVALIKSVLDGEGITYYFLGENFMYVRPLADPARLMVSKDQAQRAWELIKDLELSFGLTKPRDGRD